MNLSRVGVVPVRTSDPATARMLVERDGAAILTGVGTSEEEARAVASAVFGLSLLAVPPGASVSDGGDKDRRPMGLSSASRSHCHTDGYSYGDHYPDYFLLLCDTHSEVGGESFLVDGYAVLDEMTADPEYAWLPKALRTVPINQTEIGMRPLVGPMVRSTDRGRPMVVMANAVDLRPCDDSANPERDQTMMDVWRETVYEATDHIEHFKLYSGEAVIVDNYRLFHGREPYADERRKMWRVWMWTEASAHGAPEGVLHSDSRNARISAGA